VLALAADEKSAAATGASRRADRRRVRAPLGARSGSPSSLKRPLRPASFIGLSLTSLSSCLSCFFSSIFSYASFSPFLLFEPRQLGRLRTEDRAVPIRHEQQRATNHVHENTCTKTRARITFTKHVRARITCQKPVHVHVPPRPLTYTSSAEADASPTTCSLGLGLLGVLARLKPPSRPERRRRGTQRTGARWTFSTAILPAPPSMRGGALGEPLRDRSVVAK